jgi:hypothetical protein
MAPPSLKVAFPLITTLRIPFSLPQLQGILSLTAFTIHLLRVLIICHTIDVIRVSIRRFQGILGLLGFTAHQKEQRA